MEFKQSLGVCLQWPWQYCTFKLKFAQPPSQLHRLPWIRRAEQLQHTKPPPGKGVCGDSRIIALKGDSICSIAWTTFLRCIAMGPDK